MEISNNLERAQVIIGDITQEYFGQIIKPGDEWKIAGPFYENASIKSHIVCDYVFESIQAAKKLEEYIDRVGG